MLRLIRYTASATLVVACLVACDDEGGGTRDASLGAPTDGSPVSTPDARRGDARPAPDDAAVPDATHRADADPGPDAEPPADASNTDAGLRPDGDVQCEPGTATACLDGQTQRVCGPDGASYEPRRCEPGASCRGGSCVSDCLLAGKDPTYIGCTYWSVDLDNYPDPFGDPSAVPHAVVVTNPSSAEATITVTTQANVRLQPDQFSVPPGEVFVYTFPRLDVDGSGITNHSFRLQATWPVVVYQFNPLDNVGVASNDGTVLLPAEALGREYFGFSWPSGPDLAAFNLPAQHGYLTVVATSPGGTTVSVTPTVAVDPGPGVPALEPGVSRDFELQQFQVLNLQARGMQIFGPSSDLTGTHIRASQPVAVFGGHEEAVVGNGGCCAEHLEHQLLPVETWGDHYLAVHSEPRGGSTDVWRVMAAEDGTRVDTVPPQPDAASFTLDRGQWKEIPATESFEIMGDKPISVAQYLASSEETQDFIGDPALIIAVPVVQFRSDYIVLTPEGFNEDWLTIVRPAGAAITLDAVPVPDASFAPFGRGQYEYAWVAVGDGRHTIAGEAPFGLVAMGYSAAVSYGFAAGLNLDRTR